MALIKCPECDRQISDRAVACPHCGFPLDDEITADAGSPAESPDSTSPTGAVLATTPDGGVSTLAAVTMRIVLWLGAGVGVALVYAAFLVVQVATLGCVTMVKWHTVHTLIFWILVLNPPLCGVLIYTITHLIGLSQSSDSETERKDVVIDALIRESAIFVGLVAAIIFASYAFAFSSIENRAPIENIGIGLFSLGMLLAGLQIVAGVGLTLHQSWAGRLAQPAGLGATIIVLLSWIPVFARGTSMIGLGIATALVIGSVVALRFVPITGGDKKQSVDGS